MTPGQIQDISRDMFAGADLTDTQLHKLVSQDLESLTKILNDDTLSGEERTIYEVMLHEAGAVLARLETDGVGS